MVRYRRAGSGRRQDRWRVQGVDAREDPAGFPSRDPGKQLATCTPAAWIECFRACELKDTAAHAVYDTERCVGTK